MKEFRDHPRHKSNYDGPKNAPSRPPSFRALSVRLKRAFFNNPRKKLAPAMKRKAEEDWGR
jgi:hypothetical protein